MSVEALNWAFAQNIASSSQKLVLLALANRINNETGECFPGQESLAADVTLTARNVRVHLKALEDAKYIKRRKRFRSDGAPTSDCYSFPGFLEWLNGAKGLARAAHDAYVAADEKGNDANSVHVPPDEIDRRSLEVSTTGRNRPPNPKKNPKTHELDSLALAHPSDGAMQTVETMRKEGGYFPNSFDAFWSAYPRKVGKAAAEKLWRKMSKLDRASAIQGIRHYAESQKVRDGFVQQGDTYLRSRTWEDGQGEASKGGSRWHSRISMYTASRYWPKNWGPAPGAAGCEVPQQLINALLQTHPKLVHKDERPGALDTLDGPSDRTAKGARDG